MTVHATLCLLTLPDRGTWDLVACIAHALPLAINDGFKLLVEAR